MKKSIFLLASLMVILTGCQIESLNEHSGIDKSVAYEAFTEVFLTHTKTSMTQDRQVVWSQNDRLAIFQGCIVADEFLVTDSSDGKTCADFNIVRDNSEGNGGFSAGTEVSCNIAFYPYADGLSLSGASIDGRTSYEIEGVVLPAVQNYVAGSFGNGAFPMVAVTETMSDHTLMFKNVLGAIKLQLKGTQAVKSIRVEGNNDEKLSGQATITAYIDGLSPAIIMTGTDDAAMSVTLNCGDGVQLSENTATDFIISLPPVNFNDGFAVKVTDVDGSSYELVTDEVNEVMRSSILVMPIVELGETMEDDSAEDLIEGNEKEILLIPGSSSTTKANVSGVVDASNYPIAEKFDVYAYWANESEGSCFVDATPFLTSNTSGLEFVKKGTSWGGVEPYYWPKNGSLRFAAYSPSSLDIAHVLETDTYMVNDYIQSHETDKTCDLLLAPTTSSKTADNKVYVDFKHALTWITFKVKAIDIGAANVFTINRITLQNVYTQADLQASMSDGIQANEWMNHQSTKDYVIFEGSQNLSENSVSIETVPNGTIVIPQAATSVVIDYTLNPGGSVRSLNLDLSSNSWKPNEHIVYSLVLGADGAMLSTSISSFNSDFDDSLLR